MIAMNDFKREAEALLPSQLEAFARVLRSGQYVLGQEVEAFEAAWATYCQAPFAVGVGNGMDALEIGLRAAGLGPGDEIVTTPMTAFATVLAILRAGAIPVLADIDPATAILDPDSAKRCLTPRTRAILVVHLYGQAAPMDSFVPLCEKRGLLLAEDCAQAHGARWNGRPVGTFGTFAGWSFYPTKNLGAVGDGGALTTRSPELAERARQLRNYGQAARYHHPRVGLNSRLDELQAALLLGRLNGLEAANARRRAIANTYVSEIQNPEVRLLPLPEEAARHVHHLAVATCAARDSLIAHLRAHGIASLCHYPVPVHQQEPCLEIRRDPLGLPEAERHAATCLSLPCHPWLSGQEIAQVVDAVNGFSSRP